MFNKILIANRGEIACRIIQTCRRLGVQTVAVYSEADAGARHVRLADEAHCIGPASYLRAERILEVARKTGAQGIHPGYGFLSENETFAEQCSQAGITFIGPPVQAIRAMGSKSAAKQLMSDAGVPLVPGYHGADQDPALLKSKADEIGYPVMIKAVAGGGGKGMRVVEGAQDFDGALASCKREASSSFGNDVVLIERYVQRPRHIEIQVFGDAHGNIIHLHERDCSAQRRHQKVIEEAPAPGMSAERRNAMGLAACDAARAVGYVGAGTVEFIVDSSGEFFFMEMNTRLQVEHPVTEMITGQDLVEWQLRVASGEPLPLTQDAVPLNGHSIEVRVYAEEPEKGFLPSIGELVHCAPPTTSPNVRVDSGIEQGDAISPHYDPMIAKLIVWDQTREQAIERMLRALGEFQIVGVGNNIAFLSRLIDHAEFRAGTVDTGLIARESDSLLKNASDVPVKALQGASLWTLYQQQQEQGSSHPVSDPESPWSQADGWRLNGRLSRQLRWRLGENERPIQIDQHASGIEIDGQQVVGLQVAGSQLRYQLGGIGVTATVVPHKGQLHIFVDGLHHALELIDPLALADREQEAHGGLTSPMPGKVLALLAKEGEKVDKGAPLLMLEAMKMEHTVCAPARGTVKAFCFAAGDQVVEGVELVEFEAID